MTDEERDELISAALDGECVDVRSLRKVLAAPGGQAAAAEFLLLRAAVAADAAVAPPVMRAAVSDGAEHWRDWRSFWAPRVPAGIAASLAVVSIVGAFWLGRSWQLPGVGDAPLQPVVSLTAPPTGAAPGARPESRRQAGDAIVPPTPTRILRFTPGVDWHEGS